MGLEPRIRAEGPVGPHRFIADSMLGKLARWLRLLGFDCAHEGEFTDAELVRRGISEGRAILSRDRSLPEEWWVDGITLVEAEGVRDQLVEVIRRFSLEHEIRLFSRCAECNLQLRPAEPGAVRDRVPPSVRATRDTFTTCEGCRRVYWEGSHTERFRRVVDRLLAAA